MTDALTTLAIVGTERGGEPASVDDARGDAVLTQLGALPFESRVLLAAGARAVARFAGVLPKADVAVPVGADAEIASVCSPRLDAVVATAIESSDSALLLEAFAAIASAGQRLPAARLVDATKVRDEVARRGFAAVAGARGSWLARVHPPLAWLGMSGARSIDELERAFGDEKASARVAILVSARGLDPSRARGWLEATWAAEKADDRAALLGALSEGLSRDDEPFLEASLGDRSQGVRERAAALLSRLLDSAYVERLRTRANAAFVVEGGTLRVVWPAKWQREDVRDALVANVNAGDAARSAYAAKLVGALPLDHWRARSALSPAAFIEAAQDASGVVEGLAQAAIMARDPAWLVALLAHFRGRDASKENAAALHGWTRAVFQALPPEHAATEAAALLEKPGVLSRADIYLCASHWDVALGDRFVRELRRSLEAGVHDLFPALDRAARALPPACFEAALAPLELPSAADWLVRAHDQFQQTVRLRRIIAEETALASRTA